MSCLVPDFSGVQFYLRARLGTQKMVGKNQNVCLIKRQLETLLFVLFYLNRTCSFHFKCFSIKSLCNEAFVV